MRGGVAPFQDARALDDPIRIEAQPSVQVVVVDDLIGNVFASTDDFYPHEGPAGGSRRGPLRRVIRTRHRSGGPLYIGQEWELSHASIP